MKKLSGIIYFMQLQLFQKLIAVFLLIFAIYSCKNSNVNEQFQELEKINLKPI
jgi:hypothetical protein